MALDLTGSDETTFTFTVNALPMNETTFEEIEEWTTTTFTPPLKPTSGFIYPRRQGCTLA